MRHPSIAALTASILYGSAPLSVHSCVCNTAKHNNQEFFFSSFGWKLAVLTSRAFFRVALFVSTNRTFSFSRFLLPLLLLCFSTEPKEHYILYILYGNKISF
ncbi:hypothetical protein EUGRSUZ_L00909 [Eucalyptus grandis]|uniref:Uncharacterized protein n=1 Tax=Eucalyptus grandis TaxID=71139 RepID=A0A058ZUD6_EUCGR|nr:hypothetical protein EUGRSUZ_L00909 [Eucalyptus grandis]